RHQSLLRELAGRLLNQQLLIGEDHARPRGGVGGKDPKPTASVLPPSLRFSHFLFCEIADCGPVRDALHWPPPSAHRRKPPRAATSPTSAIARRRASPPSPSIGRRCSMPSRRTRSRS